MQDMQPNASVAKITMLPVKVEEMSLLMAKVQGKSMRSFYLQTHVQPNTTAVTLAR